MKFTLITLTILSILVIPLTPIGKTSSEKVVWQSSVEENFQGIPSCYVVSSEYQCDYDYDFRSFSVPFDELFNDWFEGINLAIDTANNLVNGVIGFFRSPFVDLETNVDISKFWILYGSKAASITYWESLNTTQQEWYENWYATNLWIVVVWYWSPAELGG